MRLKTILVATAIVSSLLGAIMAYLVLTVPNDIKSGSLLKQARTEMSEGKDDSARKTLTVIIQQYPRTDAAAAATVALVSLVDAQQRKLKSEVAGLRNDQKESLQAVTALGGRVNQIANRPAPAAPVAAPAPKPVIKISPAKKKGAPANVVKKKKVTPKKQTARRRR